MDNKHYFAAGIAIVSIFALFLSFAFGLSFGASTDSSTFVDYWLPVLSMAGGWVSGIGAFAAVGVSLWLARRQALDEAENIDASIMWGTTGGPPFLMVSVINKGRRPANIRSAVIYGDGAPMIYLNKFDAGSSPMPTFLNYGESAAYILLPSGADQIRGYVKDHLSDDYSKLRLVVSTIFKSYTTKPSKNFIDSLRK
ncbi:hypothetical protein E8F20_05995 [Pseudomonas sp. BN415]|uniref:hypothetical protein n=1 Tax=Pseudomonas sp. BN415 TaxID=2567889 RepID=UPI0024555097|nr:hypothetical protein [Pseudomonas sp. BN415]MDH4581427.1 hypothetical protein [Pseudomonas sp. BN415]